MQQSGLKGGIVSSETKRQPIISYVTVDDAMLIVSLSDGRRLSFPLDWYPRLKHGLPGERNNWRLIGKGEGIHWPDLDEDLSLEGFLEGRKSSESKQSIRKWIESRRPKSKKSA